MRLSLSSVLSQSEDPLLHYQRLQLLRATSTEISWSDMPIFHVVDGVGRLDVQHEDSECHLAGATL